MYRAWTKRNVYFGVFAMVGVLAVVMFSGGRASAQVPRQPYVRAYGNDVVAGGGYGAGCTSDPTDDVKGFGAYTGAPGHDTYVGAGSELAAFSPGVIEQFLPGSAVNTLRNSALWELSFANNADPVNQDDVTLKFGGGFTDPQCVDPFPSTAGFAPLGAGPVNLDTLDGDYEYTGGGDLLIDTSTISNAKRITIVSTSDVVIQGNITYAASNWGNNLNAIPLLRIYAEGDIKIDHSVDTVTGLFYAGGNGTGQVWTCTDGGTILTTDPASVDSLADLCDDTKLTVFGLLVGTRVNLFRTIGDVAAGVVGERYDGVNPLNNIAETIVFSPEVYLALLTEQGPPTISVGQIDAIRSLPPAF